MEKIVTRFAPSPTGYLHIGGLRTALFCYLYARANGGKFLLRIEDTDLARNSEDATKAIIEAFDWVGLNYDGEVIYQSKRFDIYKSYIQKLLDEGKAYYCYMSKDELDALREDQVAKKLPPRYDNRYRDFCGTPPAGIAPVVRIKAPLSGTINFTDGVKGEMNIAANVVDDFIIARSDGSPTYNFVVAIDDALMGVTDVIRGDDHLSNTPKQIVVYEALGFKIPKFYHVPMILNPEGHKLSKRDGAMGVMDYKALGYLPSALLNFLVRLGWSYKEQEIFSLEEMLKYFDPSNLNSSPSSYNQSKLDWLNNHYIRIMDNAKLQGLLVEFGANVVLENAKRDVLFEALKERNYTLKAFAIGIDEVLKAPKNYDDKLLKGVGAETLDRLREFVSSIGASDDLEGIKARINDFLKLKDLKPKDLLAPLRLALLGKGGGIGVAEVIYIIGVDEVKRRLEGLSKIKDK